MANELSNSLKKQIFSQESSDPFLTLVTLIHPTFTVRLVNNSKDIVSNGQTFIAFPMRIRLPLDDGESSRDFGIEFDNVSLELIENLRSVTDDVRVKLQLILASMPDVAQMEFDDLLMRAVTYNSSVLRATLVLDNFLAVQMTSEKYTPSNFPGMFS